ncbi:MAG TPA: TolC family protein [Thermodesulfobacteriota bacterium]|nr:TolC family protein [Thermodesulfobacteriota bacterium]
MLGTIMAVLLSMAGIQDTLNLSIEEAKRIALMNNRDIQIERKNLEIALGNILTQKGAFDPVLNLTTSYTDSETPTSSTFIEGGSINEKEFAIGGGGLTGFLITGAAGLTGVVPTADNGITGTLPTGTFYNLFNFSLSRVDTDSPIEELSPSWFSSLSFTVGQDLLRNFGPNVNLAQLRVARRTGDISRKELEVRIANVLLNVERAYWSLVAARENLELAKTALSLAEDLQRRNEIQVEVGVLPRVAITQAKSEVAARQVDVIRAENALQATKDTLLNILALPLLVDVVPTDKPVTDLKKFNEDEALKVALEKRPELEQAKLNVENREVLKQFYSNQKLPRLAIQGTIDLEGLGGDENPNRIVFGGGGPEPISDMFDDSYSDSFRNLFHGEFPTWQVLAIFSFPIFNWTAKGNYIQASADLDRSVITYKRVTEDIALDIRNAIREVENSLRRIEAARTSNQLAGEVLGNEEERLKVGIGTTRDVLEAQRDLVNEQTQLIRAIADYNIALAQLERAKGTLLETSGVKVEK